MQPVGALASGLIGGLTLSAEDHVADIGAIGTTSHESLDGTTTDGQCARYGEWSGNCGQVIWYGRVVNATDVIDDLIVDDGVEGRGHRLSIYNPAFQVAGVAVGEHKTFGKMVVVNLCAGQKKRESLIFPFADIPRRTPTQSENRKIARFISGFAPDAERIQARKASGPPDLQEGKTKTEKKTKNTKKKSQIKTQWTDLGTCAKCSEQIHGGRVVEMDGVKYHGDCFLCDRCEKSLVGEAEKKKEGEELLCKSCWVEGYAPTCAGCGEKIQGGVMNVTSADKAKTKTQWHKDCYEKEKNAGGGQRKQQVKSSKPQQLGGVAPHAQPFAHHLPPELFACGDAHGGANLGGSSKKKKKKKAKKKQAAGGGGGGGAKGAEDRLQAAFEEAAVRGGIVTIEKAQKNTQLLVDEYAALADL